MQDFARLSNERILDTLQVRGNSYVLSRWREKTVRCAAKGWRKRPSERKRFLTSWGDSGNAGSLLFAVEKVHSLREVLFIRVNIASTYYAAETSRAETSRRPRETCFGRRWVTTSSEFCNRFVWRFLPRVSIPGVQSFRRSQRVKFNVSRFNVRRQFYTDVTKKHQNMTVEWKKRSDRIKYLYDGTFGRMEIRNYFSCV